MNTQKLKTTSVIAALAIASIALTVGLSQTETITAQTAPAALGNNVYVFAEGVIPQATFQFSDATVTYNFQLFSQTQGFGNNGRGTSPEFTLTRIVGDTPYLYAAVDETQQFGVDSQSRGGKYSDFSITVDLVQAGEPVRTLQYDRCNIVNYKVDTRADNEEGYTTGGKTGFAVTDTFTFGCGGYVPLNPAMEKLVQEQQNRKPYLSQ
jgi:hypothetical protein